MTWYKGIIDFFGGVIPTLLIGVGGCFLLLSVLVLMNFIRATFGLCAWIVQKRRQKGRGNEREQKEVEFPLPTRKNVFLQTRLQTLMEDLDLCETTSGTQTAKLTYARKMLSLLKESALSPVERLDVEDMAKTVAIFTKKEKWTNGDLKVVNEIFSRLLKLSAKYEIAV